MIKFGQHVNEMMAVAVKNFLNFLWSRFLIIRQNVNMATNAILYSGLTPIIVMLDVAGPTTAVCEPGSSALLCCPCPVCLQDTAL